jgi:hypothetical protein
MAKASQLRRIQKMILTKEARNRDPGFLKVKVSFYGIEGQL